MKRNICSDACKLLHLLPRDGDIHNLRALISISWHTFSNGKNCNRGESQTKDRTPRNNWLILIFFPQYSSGIVGPLCQSVQSCFASNFCATILSAGSPCWTNNYHRAAVSRGPQTCSEFSSILLKRCIVHHTCQDEGETHQAQRSGRNRGIMYYVLRELRGPSLLLFKEVQVCPPSFPPPTSNLINNVGVLHVMKCHLFQVCSCCFRFSNMEMFAPKAAIKSDKEMCCNSAAIKSSRGGSGCL